MTDGPGAGCRIVYISGPVASGKTTLAFNLAALARERGITATAIDIDELVGVVAGRDWSKVLPRDRAMSWRLANAMVRWLRDAGTLFVAVAGSTLSGLEAEETLGDLGEVAAVTGVRLRVSAAEAIRRASADTARGGTRQPEAVRRLHDAVDWSSAGEADLEVDTDGLSVEQTAAFVWQAIVGRMSG